MSRALTIKNLYAVKHDLYQLDGVWRDVLGEPEKNGAWLIWGDEKNGKTWLTLLLSNYLSTFQKLYYISGEEGKGSDFINTCKRAKIDHFNKQLHINEYISLEQVYKVLKSRQGPKIIVFDNITVYNDELKNGGLRRLLLDFPKIHFIFLAHEDKGEPYTATAKLAKRLAKIIIHVAGLSCKVYGRCPGGIVNIDEERASLFHGQQILNRA